MEYYLKHHGIMGQKWGIKNGPPYPLDAEDHSAAEKKAKKKHPTETLEYNKGRLGVAVNDAKFIKKILNEGVTDKNEKYSIRGNDSGQIALVKGKEYDEYVKKGYTYTINSLKDIMDNTIEEKFNYKKIYANW